MNFPILRLILETLTKLPIALSLNRFLLFVVVLISGYYANAQQYHFDRIGLEEGLPTATINDICEGPNGFIWMASEGAGLLRFDGYSFENYGLDAFPVLEEIVYDGLGKRLYFHDGRTLWSYDGSAFEDVWQANISINQILSTPKGLLIHADSRLWYRSVDSIYDLNIGLTSDSKIFASQLGVFYTHENEMYELKFSESNWEPLLISDSIFLPSIYPDLPKSLGNPMRCKWENGFTLAIYPDGLRLFGAGKMLLQMPYGLVGALPKETFISTSSTLILVGDQGLYRISSPWESHYPRQLPILSMSHLQGQVYFSTALGLEALGEGLTDNLFENLGLILTMTPFQEELILGTELGLIALNPNTGDRRNLGVGGFVFSLHTDGETLWIGSSDGIWSYSSGQTKASLQFDSDVIEGASIFRIRGSQETRLWFASYTRGIWKLESGNLEQLDRIGDFALDSISFSAFDLLDDGQLALASLAQGLFVFDLNEGLRSHYDLRSLEFAEIRDLLRLDNQLWLGTNKGLLALNDVQQKMEGKEGASLHFFGGPVSTQGLLRKGDSLISAGDQGIFVWNVPALERQAWGSQLGIINIDLLGQDGDSLADLMEEREPFSNIPLELDLNYKQNYLRFNYSLRTLFYPDWVQYRYRLRGQSQNWTYAGARREALFTDLKAGDYHFEVQARYPWQDWVLQGPNYHFVIHTAFWRTWWFWTLLALSAGLMAYLWLRDRYRRAAERLKLENELMEMERKALRLQMNPHFIFNALDSISSFIFKKDPKQAVRYLNNFAKLMRLTLESSMEHVHPVETEVSILKNYLELEKLRFSDKFDYQIEVDDEIDYDVGLPPMLIQPHVENAILHGIKPKEGKGFLKISFTKEEDQLCCVVDDDGIGREKAKSLPGKKAHRSMATQINKDRIELLKRSIDEFIDLQIVDKHNQAGDAAGTTVIIRLPAQEL